MLVMQLGGAYVYFGVRLVRIRQEMRLRLRQLPDHELTHFVMTPQAWKKARVEDNEALVNGRMYDIARVVVKATHVHIWAAHDEAEDGLLSFLNAVVNRHASDTQSMPNSVVSLLLLTFEVPEGVRIGSGPGVWINHATRYRMLAESRAFAQTTPPPKAA